MQLGVWDLCSDIFHVNHFCSVSSWGCSLFVSFLRLTTGAKLSQQPLLVVILKKAKKKLHFGTCFIFGCLKKLVLGYLLSLKICKARLERPSRVWFRWFSKTKKKNECFNIKGLSKWSLTHYPTMHWEENMFLWFSSSCREYVDMLRGFVSNSTKYIVCFSEYNKTFW